MMMFKHPSHLALAAGQARRRQALYRRDLHHLPGVWRCLWLCVLLGGLACGASLAANPFAEESARMGAAGRSAQPAAGQDVLRMPPGNPAQAAAGATGNLPLAAPTARDLLDGLGISSIVGNRVLFRVSRGPSISSANSAGPSYGGYAGAGSSSAGSATASMATASTAVQSFSLLKAQDRRPFLVGEQMYMPVIEGFTVTLYRAADKTLSNPLWVGEPSPPPSVVLGPNTAEFSQPAPQQAPLANVSPPAVMPSAAFGSGAGITSLGAGNTSGNTNGSPNGSSSGTGLPR